MVKLDIRSWQGIFIGYEGTNQYRVYNSRKGKIHITRDLFVDEQHLYHREALNDWDYSEDDWTESDDAQFADVSDFDSSETGSSILPNGSLYSVGDNISKLPEKEGNILERQEQNTDDLNDLESELSEPPKEPLQEPLEKSFSSTENIRRSGRARAPRVLYPGQASYGSNPNQNIDHGNTPSSLARFTSSRVA